MTRLIDEPIVVHVSRDYRPEAFIWRKRVYRVAEIHDWWREPAEWWNGEAVRLVIRLSAGITDPGFYELCKRKSGWYLYRVLD